MTVAKVQHYVPQFLLRSFGNGKKDQVWVYDKSFDRSFSTNAKNIASESRFYDFELGGEAVTLEPMLSRLEGGAKSVIGKIVDSDSVASLSNEDRAMLAVFLSVQLARTKAFRSQWNDLPRLVRERLATSGGEVAEGSQAAELIRDLTENESKAETGHFMVQAPLMFAPHLVSKQWLLAAAARKHPFIIGDNPLTLQNMVDMTPRGNLGLLVRGIEIYFPLSPVRALAMWCPSLVDMVQQGAMAIRSGSRGDYVGDEVLAIDEAINSGRPFMYKEENVENFNSLQVAWSERYLFSSINDFQFTRDMLRSNPNLKRGPRATVS
jgi:hypothetical protein